MRIPPGEGRADGGVSGPRKRLCDLGHVTRLLWPLSLYLKRWSDHLDFCGMTMKLK